MDEAYTVPDPCVNPARKGHFQPPTYLWVIDEIFLSSDLQASWSAVVLTEIWVSCCRLRCLVRITCDSVPLRVLDLQCRR